MKRKDISNQILSDGKKVWLSKHGHKYTVMLSFAGLFEKPELHMGLKKNEALKIYTDYIESDMMDEL